MKRILKQLTKSALSELIPTSKLIIGGPRTLPRVTPDNACIDRVGDSVALTFDDGPHPVWTPRLLDTLQEHKLRATFFVVGQNAKRHPDLIERIAAEGHTLGNHSYTHAEEMIANDAAFLDEVKRTRHLLEDISGSPVRLVRPPKGVVTVRRLRALWNDDQCVVLWNVDPKDYSVTNPDEIVNWSCRYRPQHGDVMLWHDNHPWAIIAINVLMSPRAPHRFRETHSLPLSLVNQPAALPYSPRLSFLESSR